MHDTAAARTDTKSRLLDHARLLFAQHGYEGVSMRDIAGSVGIRQSAIYNHFENKQHLLVTLMVTHMEDLLEAMRDAVHDISDPVERLERFARFHVNYHIEKPEHVFLAYMEPRSLDEDGRANVLPLRDTYESCLRKTLMKGQSLGLFHFDDAAVTARAILAMLTGITVWFRKDGPLDQATVVENYIQLTLQSVGVAYPQKR